MRMNVLVWLSASGLLMIHAIGCDGMMEIETLHRDVAADISVSLDTSSGEFDGEVDQIRPDGGENGRVDAETVDDAQGQEGDTLPSTDPIADPCLTMTCGPNAQCFDGHCQCNEGFEGDPMEACRVPDSCSNVDCGHGATCIEGMCRCDYGFDANEQGSCTAQSPGDTALRTREQVCQRWTEDWPTRATTLWIQEPVDQCDWGELHPEVHVDALRRTSLFRWLVGLGPVTSAESQRITTQACATTLAARGAGLTHNITQDFPCYTTEASAGAGSSNIAMGRTRPADSVDLYIGDVGVPSLGHRRWIFNPSMGVTAFGQRGSYSCMYAFGGGGQDSPDYVAYPAPGFFPAQALIGTWSFSSSRYGFSNTTDVQITRVSDGTPVAVSNIYIPGGGYGQPALGWTVRPQDYERNTQYEVRITGLSGNLGDTVTYRVTITDC